MSIRIGDQAPNFKAQHTEGPIDFHQWIGDSWAVLFSHPRTSRRSARPSSDIWPSSSRNSTNAASR